MQPNTKTSHGAKLLIYSHFDSRDTFHYDLRERRWQRRFNNNLFLEDLSKKHFHIIP